MQTSDLNMDDQIVARVHGRPVTRKELTAAFDLVADKTNWKNPIDATIKVRIWTEVEMYRQAIIFFTGSVPKLDRVPCGYRVQAAGYYATIGA